ncbi:NHL repeat-containing protein [Gracilimonas mengyeensis]|uniref:NHL repeat-containing protein n=1 Tax=Gracilimonas mengyeensis TaxID=1302730 RepID=A0A521C818_9BACT|nr:NHL repeat-containing protein [Gracilimonas mengyeensis]
MNSECRISNIERNLLELVNAPLQCSIFNVQYSIFTFPSLGGPELFGEGRVRCGIGLLALLTFLFCFPFAAQSQALQQIHSGLNRATSLYVTSNAIYVVEQGRHRLLKLDHNGKLVDTIGGRGSGDYEFSRPIDVDATNGLKIYVSDFNNRRVQVFDRRGQYLSSISGGNRLLGSRQRYEPSQLAVNKVGEVLFYDKGISEIIRFDLDFSPLDAFRLPAEVKSVDDIKLSESRMYVLDQSAGLIHELETNGSYRSFYNADEIGAFYVADSNLWLAGTTTLTIQKHRETPKSISYSEIIQPVALHVTDNTAYILTSTALYKMGLN